MRGRLRGSPAYAQPLEALLMDVDSIEGKVSRRDERDSNETDEMAIANVFLGHRGLVADDGKRLAGFLPS